MNDQADPQMNSDELYREESVTDRRVGVIRVLHPIKADGTPDAGRQTLYLGSAQMMTPAGPLPLNFEIEADSLKAATAAFSTAAQHAMQETMAELQRLRRESASSIVIPGKEPGGRGFPGGGIKLP